MATTDPERPVTFADISLRFTGGLVLAAMAVWPLNELWHGNWALLAVALPATVSLAGLLYQLCWRPSVLLDDKAVVLRNVLRDVRVPWSALEEVRTRYSLTLVVGGRQHQSWAAPAGRKSDSPALVLKALVEDRWVARRAGVPAEPVRVSWNVLGLVVAVVAAGLAVLAHLLG